MRNKLIEKLTKFLQTLAGIIMLAMVLIVTIQLIARNFLKVSTPWSEEVSRLLLVWLTFIGSPVVLYKGEHLMVDLVYSKITSRARKYVNIFTSIIIVIFCCFCIKLGLDLCTNKLILKSVTAAAGIPRVYIYSALPTGAILMLIVAVNSLINNILILLGKMEDKNVEYVVDEEKSIDEIEKGA